MSNIDLQTESAIESFGNISTLTKFSVSGNRINPLAVSNLTKFLSKNNKLKELSLGCNDLQVTGIKTILSEIEILNLTTLNISGNNVNLCETAEVLTCATSLTDLDVSYNQLNNVADATWFFSILKSIFINLIKLNISCVCHEINDEAAEELANIFSQNDKLNELDLSDNNLDSKAAIKIFDGLSISSTLSKLIISHNKITDEVADNISNFLSKSTSLKVLDLSYNDLQNDGAIKICYSCADSASLVSVDFRCNKCITATATDVMKFYVSYNGLQLQILL